MLLAFTVGAFLAATCAWVSAYPTFSEIFPTDLRATGIGASVGVGRMGAVIGQIVLAEASVIFNLTTVFVGQTAHGAKTIVRARMEGETDRMTTASPGRALDLVLSPTPPPARASGISLAVLRILAGLLWLSQVWWKVPPDFGENRRTGLWFWTHLAVDHPVFPPYSWLVQHLVLPRFQLV